ncbi:MAG: alcohol dehydrogenase catalytic domain-containing protein [bacterium]|nr:alcohol dehydrogenase catalytic domain-containing protein [bacterium]
MKALYFDGRRATLEERQEPEAGDGMALVRVNLAGVCNTDLEIARGYMGFQGILGHEFVGVVETGPSDWCGERVVGEINFSCGACHRCRMGLGRHCATRRVMGILEADGAFASHVAVPVSNLHRVPAAVPDEAAVFTEPLAAAFEILEQLEVNPGMNCIVLGDGKLGLLVAQVIAGTGARVTAVGRHPEKLACLEGRGVETCRAEAFDPASANADLVVEATGSPLGFEQAIAATQPRGSLVLKSTVAERLQLDLAPLVINEIQVIGSRCGPFAPALDALSLGSVSVAPLVAETFPLARATQALSRAGDPGVLKILIDCS